MAVAPSWVARYIGLPFKEDGEGPDGINCWNLCRLVAREQFGLRYPDYPCDTPLDGKAVGGIVREAVLAPPWCLVTQGEARSPDVITFRVAPHPSHVGIFLNPQWFLHIRAGTSSALGRLDAIIWRNRIEGIWRFMPEEQHVPQA